jgi:hypothetical protein
MPFSECRAWKKGNPESSTANTLSGSVYRNPNFHGFEAENNFLSVQSVS